VDDDLDYLWLLQDDLQLRGYQVLVASDGVRALETVATEEPDLVVLDTQMPGLDGYTVCQYLREFSNIPVIMLSALSTPAAIIRGSAVGADDCVPKPAGIDQLAFRADALLNSATHSR
jgi:DNA-binding response OmpR family regulator